MITIPIAEMDIRKYNDDQKVHGDAVDLFYFIGKFFELPHEIKMLRKDARLLEGGIMLT